ncbi:hypothetical protein LO772_17040 [Yinghuangia sp. ASG 101]|uniref:phthiocerol/phthiodiolone dimycocerosyl transferase family protein n=1 Tax=Yinghuangia sp. ASG 101 TaxID=2896848 RepID=UPI001E3E2B7C|nr:hypothetical protein [Yinghuangia sp. ASG 101]UGQ15460.1 hypothetical protein LO772_17040 [Yinghuangia sp. ASG 101]
MERALSAHEIAMVAGDMRVVTVCEVHGDLDESAVERALQALAQVYPLIGGRIVFRDGGGCMRIPETAAVVRLHRADALAPELSVRTDWSEGPLLRVTLISEERKHLLVSTMPRACVEGMGLVALHKRFWALYAAECSGSSVTPTPVHPILAPPIEDSLRHKYSASDLRNYAAQQAGTETRYPPARLPNLLSPEGVPGSDPTFGATRVTVDPAGTTALANIAHRNRMSVNSLVCGVVVAALRPLLEPSTGPVRVGCGVAVDMRRRMNPPIPPEVMQSAASGLPIELVVGDDADPVELGRELSARVRENLDAGTAERELAGLATFRNMVERQPPTCTVTNLGTIPVPTLPGNQVVTDFRLLPMTRIPMPFVVVSQFDGRLSLDIAFSRACHTDAQIDDIAARTRGMVQTTVSLHEHASGEHDDARGVGTAAPV